MKRILFLLLLLQQSLFAQLDSLVPVRGFCIGAPPAAQLDSFVTFINKELAPKKVNTLILRIDFNYQYTSHPELRESNALSKEAVQKLVRACQANKIRLIPQVNLLGHQSWASHTGKLLQVYPQFDETPHIQMPENYKWPNPDGLYCKSYCPLHPDVHKVVFDIIDEICDAFETNAFHAGMDEVFYIGDDKCPRCGGRDKAELYAGEVRTLRNHLAQKNRELWIWGDCLIDGKTTGIGMWEASLNNTHRAVDLIPKDIMICDWHYDRAEKTAVYFAMKGFKVLTCPWRNPGVAIQQLSDLVRFRQDSSPDMKDRFAGLLQTVWSGTGEFLRGYYANRKPGLKDNTAHNTFTLLFDHIGKLP